MEEIQILTESQFPTVSQDLLIEEGLDGFIKAEDCVSLMVLLRERRLCAVQC